MKFNQNRDYAPLKDSLKLQIDDSVIKKIVKILYRKFLIQRMLIYFFIIHGISFF